MVAASRLPPPAEDPLLRPLRALLTGLSVLAAVAAVSTVSAHAFEKVQSFDPVPAGRGYVYYVKEADTQHQPIVGRRVTMSVQHAPGSDASVAPSDSKGSPTGPAGQTASAVTGDDGLAFFVLKTSTTPGDNEFTWQDGTYTGQVVVVGKPLGGAAPATATPRVQSTATRPRPAAPSAAVPGLPAKGMPPLAAGLFATLLVWLVGPAALRRSLPGAPHMSSGAGSLDTSAELI
jgi:hypothetical protein